MSDRAYRLHHVGEHSGNATKFHSNFCGSNRLDCLHHELELITGKHHPFPPSSIPSTGPRGAQSCRTETPGNCSFPVGSISSNPRISPFQPRCRIRKRAGTKQSLQKYRFAVRCAADCRSICLSINFVVETPMKLLKDASGRSVALRSRIWRRRVLGLLLLLLFLFRLQS